jgi:hypothetical protein
MRMTSVPLDRRLERLELITRVLSVTVVLLAGLLLLAAVPDRQVSDLIQARRVQLVDGAGHVRLDLRHDSTETGAFIIDAAGDTRIGVAQFSHGGGGVALHGPNMKGAAVLYLKGRGSLTFYDSLGAVTARMPSAGR